jgi:hypothetical protein
VGRERVAQAAEACHDLVEHEDDAVLGRDVAQALEVAVGVDDDAVGADHRLDEQRRDVLRALEGDDLFEVRQGPLRLGGGIVCEERAAVRVGREEAHHAGDARLVGPAPVLASQRACARGGAVERTVGHQHLVAAGQHAGHLEGVLVGLAAVGGEEDPCTLLPRRDVRQQFGELRARVVHHRRCDVGDLGDLLLDRLDDGRMPVPHVDRHQTGREVEVALAFVVEQVRALRVRDGRGVDGPLLAPGREHVLVGTGGGGR